LRIKQGANDLDPFGSILDADRRSGKLTTINASDDEVAGKRRCHTVNLRYTFKAVP